MEFKFDESDDPFHDRSPSFQRDSIAARETLGQIYLAATAHLAAQFRTHVFTLLVFPKYSRLIRWDRAGMVVTSKIRHADKGHLITTFFKRFGKASPEARGVDTTVQAHGLNVVEEAKVRKLLATRSDTVLYKVLVGSKSFIIGDTVLLSASSAFGRATRWYRAYDPTAAKNGLPCVFILKDTWRIWTPNRPTEYDILKRLEDAEVEHVPVAVCGSDVDPALETNHRTKTQEYVNRSWNKRQLPLRVHRHYRLVTEELDKHMQDCTTVKEAVTMIRDASIGHQQAHDKAGIVHGDVNWANIMTKRDINGILRGYLIDWDMCKLLNEDGSLEDCDQVPERTGTWSFIAARLIAEPGPTTLQTRVDDVESFFHVLIYLASMYTSHTWGSSQGLTRFLLNYFQDHVVLDGKELGGTQKIAFFHRHGSDLLLELNNVPLSGILTHLVKALALRYPRETMSDPFDEEPEEEKMSPMDEARFYQLSSDSSWLANILTQGLALPGWDDHNEMTPHKLPDLGNEPKGLYAARKKVDCDGPPMKKKRKVQSS
ncbi:hypothetical protein BDN72DRAFT_781032 [Pluteus cervinus]|uniref:Uncharacterized protein n=1 Tax=Pluteus cervinus TaxID=181527 RepID=A0ACD3A0M1_9AGAR|nr:hypothetical protein BDN72DRAFT_781032 [Pluteus cervinus]